MEYFELILIGIWVVSIFWKPTVQKIKANQELKVWLRDTEPKFRDLHVYPEDWGMRRRHIASSYNYACQRCGRKGWLGFHIHHVQPLSKGGTNNLNNLTYLCRYCHESIHPHMVEERKRKEREYLERKKAWRKEWRKKQKELSLDQK